MRAAFHANRIGPTNGGNWIAIGSSTSQISNGRILAIALDVGRVDAGVSGGLWERS